MESRVKKYADRLYYWIILNLIAGGIIFFWIFWQVKVMGNAVSVF